MSIVDDTRTLVRSTAAAAVGEERRRLQLLDELFDDSFRYAIAGMVKAGKSTLLNALVGERLAPTDAGECTRVVTWYRNGPSYEVTAVGRDGSERMMRFDRSNGLDVDLAGTDPATLDRLDVRCPTPRLVGRTLVDLPGHGSLSADVSARAASFLHADGLLPVDAVIYLTRHHHPADVSFLEAFHEGVGGASSTASVAVLSRADELGGGRAEALTTAQEIADAMAGDSRLRKLTTAVIPVAGLLAETAATLRNEEIDILRAFASAPPEDRERALRSADRVRAADALGATADARAALVARLGMFGLRSAVGLLVGQPDAAAAAVATHLSQQSGIGALRRILQQRFFDRAAVLRARVALEQAARATALLDDPDLLLELDRIRSNAHELRELDMIDALRAGFGAPDMPDTDRADLERLIGGNGPSIEQRLGSTTPLDPSEARTLVAAQHHRWSTEAESPFGTQDTVQLAEGAMRTCEALLTGPLA